MFNAGSVVTRSIPPNAIVVGNPARIIGYANARDLIDKTTIAEQDGFGVTHSEVKGVTVHDLLRAEDLRGTLSVGEFDRQIPFAAKRYFLVYDVPSAETRGEHAHRECHQFLVCAKGSCNVVVDDGKNRQEFFLGRADRGIYIPPMVWGIQYKYTSDALLLVFASHYYDAADYIRDYDYFLSELSDSDT